MKFAVDEPTRSLIDVELGLHVMSVFVRDNVGDSKVAGGCAKVIGVQLKLTVPDAHGKSCAMTRMSISGQ